MEHHLKTWPLHFLAVLNGTKTAEVRRADRAFGIGDTLVLDEWDPNRDGGSYTGRTLRRRVTHLLSDQMWQAPSDAAGRGSYVCLSFASVARPPEWLRVVWMALVTLLAAVTVAEGVDAGLTLILQPRDVLVVAGGVLIALATIVPVSAMAWMIDRAMRSQETTE